jgi:hypothetical protein
MGSSAGTRGAVTGKERRMDELFITPEQHMFRRVLILASVLLILGGAVFITRTPRVESRSATPPDDSPEACIARLLAAEQRGDSHAYLDCFMLPRRKDLETLWQGRSQSQIAAELQRQSAGMVGRAVTDLTFADPDRGRLVLERIHKDHTRRQRVALVRDKGRWQIADLSTPDRQIPAVPFGTPVFTPR